VSGDRGVDALPTLESGLHQMAGVGTVAAGTARAPRLPAVATALQHHPVGLGRAREHRRAPSLGVERHVAAPEPDGVTAPGALLPLGHEGLVLTGPQPSGEGGHVERMHRHGPSMPGRCHAPSTEMTPLSGRNGHERSRVVLGGHERSRAVASGHSKVPERIFGRFSCRPRRAPVGPPARRPRRDEAQTGSVRS
jgi:hypothetical protein